jgi:uncharacterized protein (DUF362 family)
VNALPNKSPYTRREFLVRSAKAGASITAAGLIGYWLYDGRPPEPSQDKRQQVIMPDFSVSGTGPKMGIVTGPDRLGNLQQALKIMGGIDRFIRPGDKVLLKVNAAFATPPALSATTHPDLVSELARLCFKAGARSVVVTDNPINDPTSCFALTGIAHAARTAGATLALPEQKAFQPTTLPGGSLIKDWPLLFSPFDGVNKLIGICPVKDHHRSGASMSMKNWYGLLGGRRNLFHQDIHNIIKELAMLVSPTLVVLDGTFAMMTNGPTGGSFEDLKQTDTMIVSTDQVAADAFGASLLNRTLSDLPFISKAEAAGAGTARYADLNPQRDHVDSSLRKRPF